VKRPVIVELGYGGDMGAKRMYKHGKRYPKNHYVGIDRVKHHEVNGEKPKNVELLHEDMAQGLMTRFKEGEVDMVRSRFAHGYYGNPPKMDSNEYTHHLAKTVFSRLKSGGNYYAVVNPDAQKKVRNALKKQGFEVFEKPVTEDEFHKSQWMKIYASDDIPMVTIRGKKPKKT